MFRAAVAQIVQEKGSAAGVPTARSTDPLICKVATYPTRAANWIHRLVHQTQSRCRALRHGLLHPQTIRRGPFVVANQHSAVVLHLEDVVGDGFTDAMSGALREVDIDPHHYSDLEGRTSVVFHSGQHDGMSRFALRGNADDSE
jgi:hypothetical protein